MHFIQHPEACILCKTWRSQQGFCSACHTMLTPIIGPVCSSCALPVETEGLCGRCLHHPFAFEAVYTSRFYTYPLIPLIHAFKYQKRLSFAKPLAQLMLSTLPSKTDVLIPMPLHPKRLKTRGFNQAQMLAMYLARHTHIPLLTHATHRIRDTPKQSQLNEQARHTNLQHAFSIQKEHVAGLSVTIVDDVITSGASLHALAKGLKKAGVVSVNCWVLARTVPYNAV